MSETDEQPLFIKTKSIKPLEFPTSKEAVDWINGEAAAWQWLNDKGMQKQQQFLGNVGNTVNNRLNVIRGILNNWANVEHRLRLESATKDAFLSLNIPIRNDPLFLAIEKVRENYGPLVAASFLAANMGLINPLQQALPLPILQGMVAAANYYLHILPETPPAVAGSLESIAERFEENVTQGHAALAKNQANFATSLADQKILLGNLLERSGQKIDEQIERISAEVKASIDSLNATNAAYNEMMRLRAPADYWAKKAGEHKTSSKNAQLLLILYALIAGGALIFGLTYLAILGAESSKGDTTIYLKFVAVGAIATTIVFWVGRVILRIFLSESHLTTDAEERVVMVMTYLALTNEGKIEPAERPLVLQPLFKSAADGLVKDDSAPDTTITAIVARGLDRNAPGR